MNKTAKKLIFIILTLCLITISSAFAESRSINYRIKASLMSTAGIASPQAVFSVAEPTIGAFQSAGISAAAGFVPLSEKQLLSVSISASVWQIDTMQTSESVVSSQQEAILITNDGNTSQTLELAITNTASWSASETADRERFSIKAIFCGLSDIPQSSDFLSEDTITTSSKRASGTVFAYNTNNAGVIKPKDKRRLFFKFDSPTRTKQTEQQQIQITITTKLP